MTAILPMNRSTYAALGFAAILVGGCMADFDTDEPELAETESAVTAGNRLASNRLASNRLASNRLASNSLETRDLMSTEDGREVMSYIVGCALPAWQSVTLQDSAGVQYTYPGLLNLAPAWTSRALTVSERRWITACLAARTNVFGVPVSISMRHDTNPALLAGSAEKSTYANAEGAFYGDLFATTPVLFACGNRAWSTFQPNTFRACALSSGGSSTDCQFTYTGPCGGGTTCSDKVAPFGGCKGGVPSTTYSEVITIFLTSTQQQGQLN